MQPRSRISAVNKTQEGHLEKPAFINYLRYLRYWKEPAYSKFLIYPYCLHMLELLQHTEFRVQLARGQVCRYIDDQLLLHWQHYLRKRASLIAKHVEDISATSGDVKPSVSAGNDSC